ncbi:MAG TPA: PTS galactitol transporter subunit IIB [Anaerolineae bacterium]|nr:PTS galactitol transporter subunit IIB [Anaerolineae bacterium]
MLTEKPKIILVACGRAIATSVFVAQKIEGILAERGLDAVTIPCTVAEVPARASEAALIVSTTRIPEELDTPVIVTLAFLTGMGKDRVVEQIVSYLS